MNSESMSTPTICGLEPLPTSTVSLDAPALAWEHVLASIARVEARLDASERRNNNSQPPPRPTSDPPFTEGQEERGEPPPYRPVLSSATAVTSHPQSGHGGQPSRDRYRQELPPWERRDHSSNWNRGRQLTAWDMPVPRHEDRGGRQPTAWDNPWRRQDGGGFSEPPRYDSFRSEKPRYEKMKPPIFDGSEAVNWISKVEYYFDHMGTPEDQRLHYVVMMFEGQASEWIFNYRDNNPNANWSDFLEDVRKRFDPQCFQNFIGLIAKLRQTGLLAEYNASFETMLNRVRGVPEYILLPIYIEGLTQPVKNQVRHQHPASVAAAMALAVEYDSCIDRSQLSTGFQRRSGGRFDQRQLGLPNQQPAQIPSQPNTRPPQQKFSEFSTLPVIKLTPAQKAERSRLGLCWWCPEKWVPGHNCRGKFLVYMGVDEDSEDEVRVEEEETPGNQLVTADISHIFAMEGRQKEDDIELAGTIGAAEVRIRV